VLKARELGLFGDKPQPANNNQGNNNQAPKSQATPKPKATKPRPFGDINQ